MLRRFRGYRSGVHTGELSSGDGRLLVGDRTHSFRRSLNDVSRGYSKLQYRRTDRVAASGVKLGPPERHRSSMPQGAQVIELDEAKADAQKQNALLPIILADADLNKSKSHSTSPRVFTKSKELRQGWLSSYYNKP